MRLIYRYVKSLKNRILRRGKLENNIDSIEIYSKWLQANKSNNREKSFTYKPKISILMPVYNVELQWLQKAVESVEKQLYGNWELCIVDDCSTNIEISKYLLQKQDNNIKVKILKKNSHISKASNEALYLASGEFVALLDHDDELSEDALWEVVKRLNENPDLDLIYSDEDKKSMSGERIYPAFKSNWNSELLFSFMYVGHLGVYRKSIIDEIGGFREGFEGAQDYDLILRFTEKTNKISHIPKILYHWRMIPGSTAVEVNSKSYAYDRGRIALQQSLIRRGYNCVGVEEDRMIRGNYHPIFKHTALCDPIIVFLLTESENERFIKDKLKFIRKQTSLYDTRIVLLSNTQIALEEDISLLIYTDNNYLIEMHKYLKIHDSFGQLLFIKDTISIDQPEWLEKMLVYSQRKDVGCVSGKVISSTGKIQYAGAYIQEGKKCYPNHNDESNDVGYLGRVRRVQFTTFAYNACFTLKTALLNNYMENNRDSYDFNSLNIELEKLGAFNIYNPYIEFVTSENNPAEELLKIKATDKFLNPHLEIVEGKFEIKL
ncbi:hypothetical protein A3849_29420 [Paenibacillus sp. P46E]|nr:hypothetical protein A3849_29420 [Paenibacillus sp. P46E]